MDLSLRWNAGGEAVSHGIYLNTDEEAVASGTALVDAVTEISYSPGPLDLGQTYYWKINELNEAAVPSVWQGDIWSFSTEEYLIVDNFEQYTDDTDAGEAIFQTWIDGWTNKTSSTVGYTEAPFTEQTIVHGGRQSMPLRYNNANLPCYLEVSRTWDTAQNWAGHGASTLRLFFRGETGNRPDSLYLRAEDITGHGVTVVHPDIYAVPTTEWTSWLVPLGEFGAVGVDLANVMRLCLGVGDRNNPSVTGAGIVYIDDIEIGHPISSE